MGLSAASAAIIAAALFVAMLVCLESGYRLGRRHAPGDDRVHEGLGVIEASVFGLLGLILAFVFSGATNRLDARRQLIVQEANLIRSAYLRIDLLPEPERPALRRLFREYLDARLEIYHGPTDARSVDQRIERATRIQDQIWNRAVAAFHAEEGKGSTWLVLAGINDMIQVTTARAVALHTHSPELIIWVLTMIALLAALLAGYAMTRGGRRSLLTRAPVDLSTGARS